ncbi:AMP-binding protein [Albimonas sp. CAU 1670]|uniref:AMP-binding protein n=1 Tax=Albimonas sp. CAU 1670 TaxID=3032599 RepID=UPI0023DA13FD|nr:AMP-binding protein [Albimonas sp. CAU 1670]MDF2234040.1 AMP-binding protein [Albimonas sp. CAU 1670]
MTDVDAARPRHPWEAHYPQGVRWSVPLVAQTVPQLLRDSAALHAGRPALIHRETSLTWDQLAGRAWQVANALARDGLGRGDAVAIYLPNTPFHPAFFFGALAADLRVTMLSPLDPIRVLAHKIEDSGAKTLVTLNLPEMTDMAVRLLDQGACERVILCDEDDWGPFPAPLAETPGRADVIRFADWTDGVPTTEPDLDGDPNDVALLQYTGGTTGLPKGAMLSHANLLAAVAAVREWSDATYGTPDRQVTLCVLPLFHIYALIVILLSSTRLGGTIVLRMRFDAGQTLHDIEHHRVTYFPGVPTMWIAMANHPEMETRDISSLRNCGSGGAPLPVEVQMKFERATGLPILGGWGMTETAAAGTSIPRGMHLAKPGTIGVPLPNIELKVVDADDPARDLPPGEVGEIAVRGPNISSGYWNRHDATAESQIGEGWFLTGDVGRMDADGFFWLVDRKKDLILSGGFNVYPQMIEQAIYEHPSVAECIVIGRPDPYRGESAGAFVTLKPGHEPFSLESLQAFLKDRLGRHEIPRTLVFRDVLPRTPVGKLSRKDLRDEVTAEEAAAEAQAAAS